MNWKKIIIGIVIFGLVGGVYVIAVHFTTHSISNQMMVVRLGADFRAYWDVCGYNPVTTIDWGTIKQGSSKEVTFYIKNEGNDPAYVEWEDNIENVTNFGAYSEMEYGPIICCISINNTSIPLLLVTDPIINITVNWSDGEIAGYINNSIVYSINYLNSTFYGPIILNNTQLFAVCYNAMENISNNTIYINNVSIGHCYWRDWNEETHFEIFSFHHPYLPPGCMIPVKYRIQTTLSCEPKTYNWTLKIGY